MTESYCAFASNIKRELKTFFLYHESALNFTILHEKYVLTFKNLLLQNEQFYDFAIKMLSIFFAIFKQFTFF